MTDLSPSSLLTLRELERQATPGPWRTVPQRGHTDTYIVSDHPDEQGTPHRNYVGETGFGQGQKRHRYDANANLIAAMRNALPSLLQAAERVIELEAKVLECEIFKQNLRLRGTLHLIEQREAAEVRVGKLEEALREVLPTLEAFDAWKAAYVRDLLKEPQ